MSKKWTPSLKQLSLYDELLKRQNLTRKRLLKRRRKAEEKGSSFGRPLPDLILPMKVKRIRDVTRYASRFDSYKDYQNKMSALRNLYGGRGDPLLTYYKNTYRNNFLSILKGWIQSKLNFNFEPNDKNKIGHRTGKFSDTQIMLANQISQDGGRYLDLYNKILGLETAEFMALYDNNGIPALRYIYNELEDGKSQFSALDDFLENYATYRRQVREDSPNIIAVTKEQHEMRSDWYKYAERDEKGRFKKLIK